MDRSSAHTPGDQAKGNVAENAPNAFGQQSVSPLQARQAFPRRRRSAQPVRAETNNANKRKITLILLNDQ
jgi:hypothetical protein